VARAWDGHLRAGLLGRPASNLTIEGGVRYVLWPPFHALDGNIATFNPAYYSVPQAVLDPGHRPHRHRTALQRHRPAGQRIPELGERPRGLQRSGGEGPVRRRA
jgi:hypothetical protein